MKEGDWMKTYLKRLKNPATIIGLSGYVLTILSTLGFTIDNETVMTIIKSVLFYMRTFGYTEQS